MDIETLLYDYVEPFNKTYLPKQGLHTVYFEEYGNPDGVPLPVGISPYSRAIVLYDSTASLSRRALVCALAIAVKACTFR